MDTLIQLVDSKCDDSDSWIEALNTFNKAFAGVFGFEGEHKLADDDKEKVVAFLAKKADLDTSWTPESPEAIVCGLAAIKTITRSRSGLDPLFNTKVTNSVLKTAHHYMSDHPFVTEECSAIMVNCCIINQIKMLQILKEIAPFEIVVSLVKDAGSFKAQYTSCRLLFYLTFDKELAQMFLDVPDCHTFLVDMILLQAEDPKFYLDQKRCSFFCELMKVVFNLSTHETDKKSIVDYISKEKFQALAKCVVDVIGIPLSADPEFDDKMKASPIRANICFMKLQIINCLIYIRNDLSSNVINRQTLVGLGELLEYQAQDTENPETALAPMLLVLTGICRNSALALNFFKSMIFGDGPAPESQGELQMDPEPDNVEGLDTIRSVLLKHVTSFHMTLKHHVSEFLFTLCGRDPKEYIQRTGFGNAIGLLANKGFPGFENIQQKAVNLDDLVKEQKAKKHREQEDKDQDGAA